VAPEELCGNETQALHRQRARAHLYGGEEYNCSGYVVVSTAKKIVARVLHVKTILP
jgi:hypothetical protein